MLPKVGNLFLQAWPNARALIIFPKWTAAPWFNTFVNMCNTCFILPHKGSALFEKAHAFPTCKPVRNEHWQYVLGIRNMELCMHPQWEQLKWNMQCTTPTEHTLPNCWRVRSSTSCWLGMGNGSGPGCGGPSRNPRAGTTSGPSWGGNSLQCALVHAYRPPPRRRSETSTKTSETRWRRRGCAVPGRG